MKLKFLHLLGLIIGIIVVVAIALIFLLPKNSCTICSQDNAPVPSSILSELRIPANNSVGLGLASNIATKVSSAPLLVNNKTVVFYAGAEYCPYCAIERWGLVVALLRFGNFTGLSYMTSSPTDIGPSTPTFTFYNSNYTSNYIVFESLEATRNILVNGTYPQLQTPTLEQQRIINKFDQAGSIPFLDIANKTVQIGASYSDPTVFIGMNWSQIAAALQNSSTTQAQVVIGSANLLTAQICAANGNMPQSVCGTKTIATIEKQIAH